MTVWRPLDGIPVFAKAGGIVPDAAPVRGGFHQLRRQPQHLEIIVFPERTATSR